jgi:alkylation response protein AidB-like acyl-CoA dehydrogenase
MAVPAANLLGEEGKGFQLALRVLDHSRPGIAAQALGIAQGAFDVARRYTRERRQFGRAIADFEGVQFMLADMATQIEAARALTIDAAKRRDAGASYSKNAAMAKLFATDTAMRVTTDAVQIHGGYGYVDEFPVERYMREAKVAQIFEGTNQIQRLVIGRALTR